MDIYLSQYTTKMIDGFNGMSPTWVMLCRNELCQKIWKKRINKIILSVDSNLNMMKNKVCIGDLTSSNVLI